MKRILLIIISSIFFSTYSNASLIELNNCFKIKNSQYSDPYKFFTTARYEKSIWSINFDSNLITHQEVYTKTFLDMMNKKPEYQFDKLQKINFTDYEIVNYTSELIIGRKYVTSQFLRELLRYPNEKTVHWEVRVDLKENIAEVVMMPDGNAPYDYSKLEKYYTYQQFVDQFATQYKWFKCESQSSDSNEANEGSSGTAFFINARGNLLTNQHVVDKCKELKINYFNKEYDVKLISTDKTLDLALLEVKVKPKNFIKFSNYSPEKLQKVFVAGFPFGKGLSDDLKISSGIISSLKGFQDNSNELQIDAAINKGNSGGPIVGEGGELVAVAVSGLAKEVSEGINFGIKSSSAVNFLEANDIKINRIKSSSLNNKKLLRILEESTTYISCLY